MDKLPLYASDHPFDTHRIHALAIYCSDGRFGEQFDDFLQNHLDLPRYDRLAVPGGPACLAGHYGTANELAGIKDQIKFLIDAHSLETVVLIQHHGCAFYSEAMEQCSAEHMKPAQDNDLMFAKAEIRRMAPSLKVMTVYARLVNNHVQFERVVLDD